MNKLLTGVLFLLIFQFLLAAEDAPPQGDVTSYVVEPTLEGYRAYLQECAVSARKEYEMRDGSLTAQMFQINTGFTLRRMERKLIALSKTDLPSIEKAIKNVDYICGIFNLFFKLAEQSTTSNNFVNVKRMIDANLDRISGIIRIAKITENAEEKIANYLKDGNSSKVARVIKKTNDRIGSVSTKDAGYYFIEKNAEVIRDSIRKLMIEQDYLLKFENEVASDIFDVSTDLAWMKVEVERSKEEKKESLILDIQALQEKMSEVLKEYKSTLHPLPFLPNNYTPEELWDYILENKTYVISGLEFEVSIIENTVRKFEKTILNVESIEREIENLQVKYDRIFNSKSLILTIYKRILVGWKNDVNKKIENISWRLVSLEKNLNSLNAILDINRENLSAIFDIDWSSSTVVKTGTVTY